MKKYLYFVLAATVAAALCFSCKGNAEREEGTGEEELSDPNLRLEKPVIKLVGDGIYSGKPTLLIELVNNNDEPVVADAEVRILTDIGPTLVNVDTVRVKVPAGASKTLEYTYPGTLDPGFYASRCKVTRRQSEAVNFGIDPTQIVSAPDTVAGEFAKFWQAGKDQLAAVDSQVDSVEIKSRSSSARKVYFVSMKSVPDSLGDEPVTIRGYYAKPLGGGKHPVIIHYYPYDSQTPDAALYCPYGGSSNQFAELWISHRGQYINNRNDGARADGQGDFKNTYGDWFAWHFGDRDSWYYRGAMLDALRAVRFMLSEPTSDPRNFFACGSSQGGALTYAAAALSNVPFRAIAPNVAFLGDFPDYFRIVGWPKETAVANQGNLTDAQMYEFLSYFDTKNLATMIPASCAVMATICLQDHTCPPHTNIAPYNNLKTTDKELSFYPYYDHAEPGDWTAKYLDFFGKRIVE